MRGFEGQSDSAHQPPAGEGNDDRVNLGEVFQQFQPDGSLPRDDKGIVKGIDPAQAPLLEQVIDSFALVE